MPGAVADASVLIGLALVGRFELLRRFYPEVLVPPAVWREVVDEGQDLPGAAEAGQARAEGWFRVVEPKNRDLVRSLGRELDLGEAEAIALALETGAETVLLDEAGGRRAAEALGLSRTGVLGLLLRARRAGALASLREDLDRLQRAGFWLADGLAERLLEDAGEGSR